jgi:acetyl esterase/lipase
VDSSLIRQDILDFLETFDKMQQEDQQSYLEANPPLNVDLRDLGMKLYSGNRQWLLEREAPKNLLSRDEMMFIAKMGRRDMDSIGMNIPGRPIPEDASFELIMIDSITAEWQRTPKVSEDSVILYFHGGSFAMGSPKSHRRLTIDIGRATSMKILSVDYRLAPEHPFPASIEDGLTAYNWLLSEGYDSSKIVIAGDSAGGYGIPLPAAGVCLAPATDLTFSDDSFFENTKTDPLNAVGAAFWMVEAFLNDADPTHSAVSPLFAKLEGLPPLLIQASKIEMIYSDSERFVEKAEAAGVDVTFQTWDDMLHVFQCFDFPETDEAIGMIGAFVKEKIS